MAEPTLAAVRGAQNLSLEALPILWLRSEQIPGMLELFPPAIHSAVGDQSLRELAK